MEIMLSPYWNGHPLQIPLVQGAQGTECSLVEFALDTKSTEGPFQAFVTRAIGMTGTCWHRKVTGGQPHEKHRNVHLGCGCAHPTAVWRHNQRLVVADGGLLTADPNANWVQVLAGQPCTPAATPLR